MQSAWPSPFNCDCHWPAAFLVTMTWQVLEPVVAYSVFPAAVFSLDCICRLTRLVRRVTLLWAVAKGESGGVVGGIRCEIATFWIVSFVRAE
jgi:hypothetical protein